MKNNILTTLFAATLALSAETQASSLTTLFAPNNAQDGNMFDVVTFGNSLTVTGFDLNFRDTGSQAVTVEVYSKGGTWVGSETNASAWTLIDTIAGVISANENTPVFVDVADFALTANSTTGLYITVLNTDARNLGYTNGTAVGNVAAANADLQILEGAGKSYPFGTTPQPRIWNGTIYYDVASVPEPATLALFVIGLVGTAIGRQSKPS